MKKRDYAIIAVLLIAAVIMTPLRGIIAQTSYSVGGWLGLVTDTTNDSLQISIVSTDANQTIGGNLAVTGTSTLTGDVTVGDDITIGGWPAFPSTTVSTQSYTISSTGKAAVYISEYSDTAASTIFLPDTPADGTFIMIADGDLNASANNVTIGTEGSDTINEGATFAQNANGESTQFVYDAGGTDWSIVGGYLE